MNSDTFLEDIKEIKERITIINGELRVIMNDIGWLKKLLLIIFTALVGLLIKAFSG